jgi:hypothetical protein
VIAAEDGEEALGVGPGSLLYILDPRAIDAERNLMLSLAGDRAGVAPDAHVLIDHETVSQDPLLTVTDIVAFSSRWNPGMTPPAWSAWGHHRLIE